MNIFDMLILKINIDIVIKKYLKNTTFKLLFIFT